MVCAVGSIASQIEELNDSAEQMSANMEEVSASMEGMAATAHAASEYVHEVKIIKWKNLASVGLQGSFYVL